jgi:16S rRNA (cytosine967-C5)-methyltransferase
MAMRAEGKRSAGAANVRGTAARIIDQVRCGERSLSSLLPDGLDRLAERDRPLARELVQGVLRHLARLESITAQLLDKPLRRRDSQLHALILVGLYQQIEMRIPDHAAISETVAAASGPPWAKGLINGVLRNFQRRRETLLAGSLADPVRFGLPEWLFRRLQVDWPDHWQTIAGATLDRPPLTLRTDLERTSREAMLDRLREAGIVATPSPLTPTAIVLERPCEVHALPGFDEGLVSVQDEAAQQAALLLAPQAGERLLDACAAPGGKTIHLLEQTPGVAELVAIDNDQARLERVKEALKRCRRSATLLAADAAASESWWDGRQFDRILLDAPCSASGVVRRHPDSKWLRRESDIGQLVARQQQLLDRLWPLLRPGGRLLYATCSVLRDENDRQIDRFLAREREAKAITIGSGPGIPAGAGRQILTGLDGMDGFFYALLERSG